MKTLRQTLLTVLLTAIAVATFSTTTLADTTPSVVNNDNATVTVNYSYSYANRVKVLVTKDSTYQYELTTGNNSVELPLTEGNGTYTIKVCKNVEGTKYSVISKFEVTVNETDANEVFTVSNQIVNFDENDEAVKLAAELTKDLTDTTAKIDAIRDYVVENYSYDYNKINTIAANTTYVPSIEETYTSKTGICYDLSSLVAAMLRSVDVPCKVVKGYTPKASTYHAWNQVFVNGKWETMDVTYDVQIANEEMFKNVTDYSDVRYQY